MTTKPGLLIALEGPDVTGCTTHAHLLAQALETSGYAARVVQPGRSSLMRKALPALWDDPLTGPTALALAEITDLADLMAHEIDPALAAGTVVILDRYTATLQARAWMRGADRSWLQGVLDFAPAPTLSLWLTCPPSRRLNRVLKRPGGLHFRAAGLDSGYSGDRERAFLRYQNRLDQRLAALLGPAPQVDTSGPTSEAHERIWSAVQRLMGGSHP